MGKQAQSKVVALARSQPPAQSQAGHLDEDTTAAAVCGSGDGSFFQDLPTTTDSGTSASLRNSTSKLPRRPRKIRKLSPDSSNRSKPSQPDVSTSAGRKLVAAASKAESNKVLARLQQGIAANSLISEGEIEIALRHLRDSDPHLAPLIDFYQPPSFETIQTPFLALTRSILFQQLAPKAGASIYARFVSLCGGDAGVVPSTVLALTPPQLRQVGVSGRKANYLHDLAGKYQSGMLSDSAILEMDDKSLLTSLTMVKGIGPWSVHMYMIFSLHMPDVLPSGDLGVRKGVQLLYGLKELPAPPQMEQLCEKWRPYRTVAAWYLWRLVEGKGMPSASGTASAVALGTAASQQKEQQPLLIDSISSLHS